MLVLSRKPHESAVVTGIGGGDRILRVTVIEVRGTKVRLGFEVDGGVPVHRCEVWERIHGDGGLSPSVKSAQKSGDARW